MLDDWPFPAAPAVGAGGATLAVTRPCSWPAAEMAVGTISTAKQVAATSMVRPNGRLALISPLSTVVGTDGLPLPPKRPHPMQVANSLQDARGGTWPPLASDLFALRYPWIETSSGI